VGSISWGRQSDFDCFVLFLRNFPPFSPLSSALTLTLCVPSKLSFELYHETFTTYFLSFPLQSLTSSSPITGLKISGRSFAASPWNKKSSSLKSLAAPSSLSSLSILITATFAPLLLASSTYPAAGQTVAVVPITNIKSILSFSIHSLISFRVSLGRASPNQTTPGRSKPSLQFGQCGRSPELMVAVWTLGSM
jgi:hypothetical protein